MFTALLSERYAHLPLIVFLGSGAAVGLLLGAFNGVCVGLCRIPPIVTTIGTLSAFRGTIYLLSGGAWVTAHEMPPEFRAFPLNRFLGLQNIVWIAAALAAATWVYLTYFRGGRQVYAVGINPQAARYVSIDAQWTEFKVYCIWGDRRSGGLPLDRALRHRLHGRGAGHGILDHRRVHDWRRQHRRRHRHRRRRGPRRRCFSERSAAR